MKKMIDRVLSLFLSVCLVGTFICGNIMGAVLAAGETAEKGTHVIITHWHADGTVIDDNMGDLTENSEIIDIKGVPYAGEKVAGYSISVGDDAFIPNGENYSVKYNENVHLAKMNVFYQKEADYDGKVDIFSESEKETDVKIVDGKEIYNSSEGLHTNKDVTASGESGREFDITLQSWYNEGQVADVGLILDASGSMAFTADTPSLINKFDFDDEEVSKFDNLTYIPPNILDKILDPEKTDNSRLGYGGYSYFVFDAKKATAEFVPLGYWDGTIGLGDEYSVQSPPPESDTMGYLLDKDLKGLKGWFYVNSATDYNADKTYGGSKQYIGVEDQVLFQNYVIPEGEMGISAIGGPFVSPSGSGVAGLDSEFIKRGNNTSFIFSSNADLATSNPKEARQSWSEFSFSVKEKDKINEPNLPQSGGNGFNGSPDGYVRGADGNNDYKDTDETSKSVGHSPVIFYFDNEGYLRCFFCNGYNEKYGTKQDSKKTQYKRGQCSYVFKKDDSQRIKTETLQAGLGRFVTALNEKSPDSKVSAVRFSLPKSKIDGYDDEKGKFVLQDWTNDYTDMLNIISRSKGEYPDNYFSFKDEKEGTFDSYNYGLTGNTSTDVGLDIMNSLLISKLSQDELDSKSKNLIIFTDGKDSGVTDSDDWGYEGLVKHDAYKTAKRLKAEGWTIYCVVVPNGELSDGSWALRFIESLSGTAETDKITQEGTTDPTEPTTEAPSESTTESATTTAISDTGSGSETTTTTTETPLPDDVTGIGTDDVNKWNNRFAAVNDKYCFLAKNSGDLDKTEALVQTFTDEVLSSIVGDLEGYTVQDFIDPRFDIVDGDKVIKLGDGGNITVDSANHKVTKNQYYSLSDDARLFYDDEKQMYFVKWENQSIPGNAVDVDKVNVWEKHLKLRAKDDFIGGNAVLTNGNGALENYVFHPEDTKQSSGTDDMASKKEQEDDDLYPSKGFPRTVANVKPLQPKLDGLEQVIYKGESIVPKERAAALLEAVKTVKITKDENEVEKEEELVENPYLDFIKEYAKKYEGSEKEQLEALAADVIKSGENGLTLDGYTYSDAGSESHKKDPLGSVTLRFTGFDDIDPADELTLEDKKKEFGLEIEFTPMATSQSAQDAPAGTEAIAAEPEDVTNREEANEKLLESDSDYKWDPDEKPAGDDVETVTVVGNDTTYTVSGEIAFAVNLDEQDIQALQDSGSDERITYSVDLKKGDESIDKVITVSISPDKLTPGFHYAQNVEDLEFGDYTLENIDGDTDEIKFSEIKLSGDEQEYKNIKWKAYPVSDGDVKIDPPDAEANRYIAPQNGEKNAFRLGTAKNDSSPAQVAAAEDTSESGEALIKDDKSYLNDRLGFAYVDVEIVTTTTTTTTTSTTTTTTTVATSLSDTESTEKPSEESTTESTTTTEEPVKPPVSDSTTTAASTQTKPATTATTPKVTTHTDPAATTTITQKVTTHTDPASATTTTQKVTTHTDSAVATTTTQKVTTHTDPASATTTTQKVTTHTDPASATTTTQKVTTHTDPAITTTITQNVTTHTDPEATTTTQKVTTHTDPQNTTTAPGETGVSPGTGDTTTSAPTTDGGFAVTGSTTTTAGNDTQSPPATTPTTPTEPSSPSDTAPPSAAGGTTTTPAGTGTSALTTTTTTTTTGSGGNSGTHSPHTGDTKRAPFAMLATFAAIAIIARKAKKRDE